jgi:hypothetical protein
MNQTLRTILVGDNPFHGVSHVSRERSLQREGNINNARFAAELVMTACDNGATGFTFTVSETTLDILSEIGRSQLRNNIDYYPLVPNVTELIRTEGSAGGIPGLAKAMARKLASRFNGRLSLNLAKGVILNDPGSLFKSYIIYEYLRLKSIIGKGKDSGLKSILLHEVVTDMALALDMEWLFKAHIGLMTDLGLKPGFETRNLMYLVKRFQRWQIDTGGLVIEAPFNAAGFQMCPSRADCEEALRYASGAEVIAFSVLAAGYLKLPEALDYIGTLKGLSGMAIGVSSRKQAVATFSLARQIFS